MTLSSSMAPFSSISISPSEVEVRTSAMASHFRLNISLQSDVRALATPSLLEGDRSNVAAAFMVLVILNIAMLVLPQLLFFYTWFLLDCKETLYHYRECNRPPTGQITRAL